MTPGHDDMRAVGGTPDAHDLVRRGEQAAVFVLTVIRAITVAVVLVLALLSPDVRLAGLLAIAALAVAEVGWTSARLARADTGTREARAVVPLLLDALLLVVAVRLSGGADSYAIDVAMVLPIAASVVVGPVVLAALGICTLIGFAFAVGTGSTLAVIAIEGTWAVTVGGAVGLQRRAFLQRLGQVDAATAALRAPGRQVRDGIGPELRAGVVGPLTEVRRRLGARGRRPLDAAALGALASRVAGVAVRVRSILSELHAPGGPHAGLQGPVTDLVARRAPAARREVQVRTPPDPAFDAVLGSIVRDALTAVASTASADVRVAITPTAGGAAVEVAATPPLDRGSADAGERRSVLALRVAGVEGRLEVDDPVRGVVRVLVRDLRSAPDVDARAPLGAVLGVRQVLVVCWMVGAVAGLAVGSITGGNDAGWWVAATATVLFTVPTSALLLTRALQARGLVALIAADMVPIVVLWAMSGPETQRALLPIGAMFPVAWSFVAGPALVVAISAAVGALLAAFSDLGDAAVPAVVTGVWATAIGVMLATAGAALAARLRDAARRRNRSLRVMLGVEERERRRLAADLHDDALQLLLAARQDLVEAAEGDPEGTALALHALDEADRALRRVLSALDLDDRAERLEGGLRAALERIADDVRGRRGGPDVALTVDPGAEGRRDGLLVRVVRELLANAVRHAAATTVRVAVSATADGVRLDVEDDGVGFDLARVTDAVGRGHLGLAALEERVRDAGGTTDLRAGPGGGAHVRVVVPGRAAPAPARPAPRA